MTNKFIFFSLLLALVGTSLMAQDPINENRKQFAQEQNLEKFFQRATDAGLTEEDLKSLDLKFASHKMNVSQYLSEIKERRRIKDAKLRAFMSKNFLTVQDVYKELSTVEPQTLAGLRDALVGE
ncbi:MAG: hypothetical protein QNL04_04350 [SAR324 cluster bacterium]|nr:hypothetical protein [SAR324 cluster bacterium]